MFFFFFVGSFRFFQVVDRAEEIACAFEEAVSVKASIKSRSQFVQAALRALHHHVRASAAPTSNNPEMNASCTGASSSLLALQRSLRAGQKLLFTSVNM